MSNGKSISLVHLANHHSNNIGNGALIFGLERVFQEDLGPRVVFTPEPWDDFGQIEEARGVRRFSFRGLAKVTAEWALICLTHNLLKLFGAGACPALA